MKIETERKFLVKNMDFLVEAVGSHSIAQGYIAHDGGNTVRVRLLDGQGIMTVKGPSHGGISRMEWEKEISAQDFKDLLQVCHGSVIEKTRYIIPAGQAAVSESHSTHGKDRFFEVDVFHGDNEGLVMAEIELGSEEEAIPRPSWLGEEVTGDKRYYNSYLTMRPYKTW